MALYVDVDRRDSGRLRLDLGRLVMSKGIDRTVSIEEVYSALQRHAAHDWGEVTEMDWLRNDAALIRDERILSVYRSSEGLEFWIITEADRSATTVLLPEEG